VCYIGTSCFEKLFVAGFQNYLSYSALSGADHEAIPRGFDSSSHKEVIADPAGLLSIKSSWTELRHRSRKWMPGAGGLINARWLTVIHRAFTLDWYYSDVPWGGLRCEDTLNNGG
jgi:hypothetical protein